MRRLCIRFAVLAGLVGGLIALHVIAGLAPSDPPVGMVALLRGDPAFFVLLLPGFVAAALIAVTWRDTRRLWLTSGAVLLRMGLATAAGALLWLGTALLDRAAFSLLKTRPALRDLTDALTLVSVGAVGVLLFTTAVMTPLAGFLKNLMREGR